MLLKQSPHRGAEQRPRIADGGAGLRSARCAGRRPRTSAGGAAATGAAHRAPARRFPSSSAPELRRGFTSAFTGLRISTKMPLGGRRDLHGDLVGLQLHQRLVLDDIGARPALHQRRTVARVPSSFGGTNTSASRVSVSLASATLPESRHVRSRRGIRGPVKSSATLGSTCVEQQGAVRAGHIRHGETLDRRVQIEECLLGERPPRFRRRSRRSGCLRGRSGSGGSCAPRPASPRGPRARGVRRSSRSAEIPVVSMAFSQRSTMAPQLTTVSARAFAQQAGLAERHDELVARIGAPRPAAVEQRAMLEKYRRIIAAQARCAAAPPHPGHSRAWPRASPAHAATAPRWTGCARDRRI